MRASPVIKWSGWDTAIVVFLAWFVVGIISLARAGSRGRVWSKESAIVLAGIGWLLTGLSAGTRLPSVSWWLVAWVAESCAFLGYLVGHDKGDRDASQRLERDEREREEARERFAREQAAQVQHSSRN